jgi:sugar phosphate isomerase/epimerase
MNANQPLAVFVKPWKALGLPDLGRKLQALGVAWIELPVRPGFACQPETIEQDLPQAARVLGDYGVRILNVAADLPLDDERLYAACAAAGVDLNRVMFRCRNTNYWQAEAEARRSLEAALPLCAQYGVRIGVQNHAGAFVGTHEFGLYHLLKDYDRRFVGAIWDAAHNALEGMDPEPALDVMEGLLYIVNLKNGYWQRASGPEAAVAEWKVYWTGGRYGRAHWPRVVAKLKAMSYRGPICLTAEYSDEYSVDRLIAEDLAFARDLLAG